MPGKTPRVLAAQEALDAAIREMIAACDEMDVADFRRLGKDEETEEAERMQSAVLTHWAVATARVYWSRDPDDVEDTAEYPVTKVSALVRDETMADWVCAGLFRRAADVVDGS